MGYGKGTLADLVAREAADAHQAATHIPACVSLHKALQRRGVKH